MRTIGRREFLAGTAATALLARRAMADEAGGPPLRERAARKGLFYGAAIKTRDFADAAFAQAYVREVGMVVPEWETKRNVIERSRGTLDFSSAEKLHDFAQTHDMVFRGHCLVWHQSNPIWLERAVAKADEAVIVDYAAAVAAQFAGRMHSWDVVNEAIDPKSGRPDGLRESFWLKAFGERYLDLAFQAARAGDPGALLVYNDFDLEYAGEPFESRRRSVLGLLERLRSRDVPVGALGMQAHLRAYGRTFDAKVFGRFLAEVAGMGLKIIVSELDVIDSGGPGSPADRDRAVADMTRRHLDVVLARPETLGVVTWGLSDRYTWLAMREAGRRSEGQQPRVLPLDTELRRKPMWTALAQAFDAADMRGAG